MAEAASIDDSSITISRTDENVPRGTFVFIQSSVAALYADWDLCLVSEVAGTLLTIDGNLTHDYPAGTRIWPVLFGRPIKESYSILNASRARDTVSLQFDARQINATAFDDFSGYSVQVVGGEDESSSSEGITGFNFYWSFDDLTLSPGVFDIIDENYGMVANAYPAADVEARAGIIGNGLHLIRQPFFFQPSFNTPFDARLITGTSGVTIAGWFNIETIGSQISNSISLVYSVTDTVLNIISDLAVVWLPDGTISLGGFDLFEVPPGGFNSYTQSYDASALTFGDWHFLVMRWNRVTGFADLWIDNVLKLSINNHLYLDFFAGAAILQWGYVSAPLTNDVGFDIDELGFYGEFLDEEDMTYLYNGGSGRGNPGSFEPTRTSSSSSSS